MLSKQKLQAEITSTKAAIKSLQETMSKCEDGILINQLVLQCFEEALSDK